MWDRIVRSISDLHLPVLIPHVVVALSPLSKEEALTNIPSTCRNAVIIGPADTPFEDGTFRLVMHFEEQYPNKPPSVKFISEMFHPNVYNSGDLCLDILQNRWSPTYDVAAILTSIQRYVFSAMFYWTVGVGHEEKGWRVGWETWRDEKRAGQI